MNRLVLFFVTLTMSLSAVAAGDHDHDGGNGSGGGNTLAGRMIESYIKDPRTLKDFRGFLNRVNLVRQKSPDLYAVLAEGILHSTWYFIPADLKELSQSVTGLPFNSDQGALHVFDTREIWVDLTGFDGMKTSEERQKMLAHEAILGGTNSFFLKVTGKNLASRYLSDDDLEKLRIRLAAVPQLGLDDHFQSQAFVFKKRMVSMPEVKALLRPTVALIFSPSFASMTPAQVMVRLSDLGWVVTNGRIDCVTEPGLWSDTGHHCAALLSK